MPTVAVLGTGTMGAPMARNLAAAGFDVRAWNRTRERAEPLSAEGIAVFDQPAEAAAGADLLLTMLPTGDVVRGAAAAALDALADGAAWIQCSTVGAEAADALGELAAGHGVAYVDAPVSGTKAPAEAGELVVLASGPDDVRERVQPALDAIGARTLWLGPAGAGSRLKLVVNTWLLALVEGLAEAIALAEGLGVEPGRLLEVIEGGPLDAPYAQLKGQAMVEGAFEPSFALRSAAKDAGLVRAAADAVGLDLPLPRAIEAQMARGADAGFGEQDMAATVRVARGEA